MASWEPVVHGPMNIDTRIEDLDADIKVDHAGASRQGFDLMCALDLGCAYSNVSGKEMGILRLSSAEPVNASQVSSTPLFKRGVDMAGNFQIHPIYTSTGVQGLGLSDGSASYRVLAYYKPEVGTQIWYTDDNGAEKQIALVSSEVVTQPQITRTGNSILVKALNYSGKTWEKKLELTLPTSIRVDVLAQNCADAAPVVIGKGVVTDPNSQIPPSPPASLETYAEISVMHAEVRGIGENNTSRPKIVILNTSEKPINGFKLAYYFTADPEHNPRVELDYPQKAVSLEYLGGRNWRFVIDASDVLLAGKSSYPNDQGWQIRLHYADWQYWHHLDDYSADYSLGIWKWNEKIVVYDATGNILWGKEPIFVESTSPVDPKIPEQGTVTMTWRDVAPWEANILKPEITIQNSGSVAVENYRARLYFRAPSGKFVETPVEDWYTPNSIPSLTNLGNGLWQLEFDFSGNTLASGASMVQGNVGAHLTDWTTMEKSFLGGAVLDGQGRLIFGSLWDPSMVTPIPPTIPENLEVWLRDESSWESNYFKPRFRIFNRGLAPVRGFDLHYSIQAERGLEPVLETWDIPGCEAQTVDGGNGAWSIDLTCSNLSILPGNVWPNEAGAVVGLHFSDWTIWDRSNDPSFAGITGTWERTSTVGFSNLVSP